MKIGFFNAENDFKVFTFHCYYGECVTCRCTNCHEAHFLKTGQ
jgi:hypothetical protein